MKVLGIIPARYASTRFPGKPLCRIGDKSMIQRVYEQASESKWLSEVVVATDSESIFRHVREFGGRVRLTAHHHRSGTERCIEVVRQLAEEAQHQTFDVILNIQGDEPFIDPGQIDLLAAAFDDPAVSIGSLMFPIRDLNELMDPNVVKVVVDDDLKALYFSRSPVPYVRGVPENQWLETQAFFAHMGVYGFRSDILLDLEKLTPTALEQAESLEQLRWLQHGYAIYMRQTEAKNFSIDTPQDLQKILDEIT